MKRIILYLSIIFCGFVSISCQRELTDVKYGDSVYSTNEEIDYLSVISSLGYSTDDIQETDSLFIISDVIVIRKKDLREIAERPTTRITADDELDVDQQHIRLDTYMFDSQYMSILEDAVREWNSVPNCNILFSYGSEYSSADGFVSQSVYISDDSFSLLPYGYDYDMRSFIKVSPIIANTSGIGYMAIDTDHSTWTQYTYDQKKWALVHALGLLIGLNPDSDQTNSIMYNKYATPNWTSFSNTDISELVDMYPLTVKSFSLTSNTSQYLSDVQYTFTPNVEYYKEFVDTEFEYNVVNTKAFESHTITVNSNGSAQIKFLASGTYTITCKIKSGNTVFAETSKTVTVSGDLILPDANDIKVNKAFTVTWGCNAGETLECTVSETIFGNNPSDYEVIKESSSKYSVKIKDYGNFVITFSKKNSNGAVVDLKQMYIARFYRPAMSFPEYAGDEDDVLDYRLEVFEFGCHCPEDMSEMIVTSVNPAYNIVVGDGTNLAERLYVRIYAKYYRSAFFPPNPVCRGPVTDINDFEDRIFSKGSSAILTMPQGKNGYIEVLGDGRIDYTGYYGVIIPKDESCIVQ